MAAGIAAAFNAPIAAITFTLEELIGDLDQTMLSGVIRLVVEGMPNKAEILQSIREMNRSICRVRRERGDVLDRVGVRKIINASGPATSAGGVIMGPENHSCRIASCSAS